MTAVFDVSKYGAVGDGEHDDSDVIQELISKAVAYHNTTGCLGMHPELGTTVIQFPTPKKYYRLTKGLVIRNGHRCVLRGTAPGAVVLKLEPDEPMPGLSFTPPLLLVPKGTTDQTKLLAYWTAYLSYVRSRYLVYFTKKLFTAELKPYFPQSGAGDIPNAIEALTLVGGGVLIGGEANNRFTGIRDCTIRCLPDGSSAVMAEDQTITTVDISRCIFEDCYHGVNIGFGQCDFWTLDQCRFLRNRGIDLLLGTSGCHVYDSEFREKQPSMGGALLPYMQIKEGPEPSDPVPVRYESTGAFGKAIQGSGGNNRFTDCRFGDDVTPPEDLILIGPSGPDGTYAHVGVGDIGEKDLYVADVQFDGCQFGGPSYVSSKRPRAMLRLTVPCKGLRLLGCSVWACQSFVREDVVTETWKAALLAMSGDMTTELEQLSSNSFGNSVEFLNARGRIDALFSEGGRGFETIGEVARDLGYPESDPERPTTNFLRGSGAPWKGNESDLDQPPGKVVTDLSAVAIVAGAWPLGIEAPGPFAWDLMPTTPRDFYVVQQRIDHYTAMKLVKAARGGPAVFSVWLRAGRLHGARIDVHWSEFVIGGGGSVSDYFTTLTKHWERYEVVIERLPSATEIASLTQGPTVRITVNNDLAEIPLNEAAFSLAMPQLELGRSASLFSPSGSIIVPRGPRPSQAVPLGGHLIEYGHTEPGSWSEQWHAVGDLVINTQPNAGGWRGWICTMEGRPGTWHPYGKIEP